MLHFAANFWWLIFPLGGAIGTGIKAVAAANEPSAGARKAAVGSLENRWRKWWGDESDGIDCAGNRCKQRHRI